MSDEAPATMTHERAIERLPETSPPDFWVGSLTGLDDHLETIDRGTVTEIGESPGGRSISCISYGGSTMQRRRANYNSAVAAGEPSAYRPIDRETPVVFLLGPVHGHEVEGLTGLCNLLSVLETGSDCRGTEHPRLRSLATQCRLVVVPCGNPDGLARFEPESLNGLSREDLEFWGQGTVDGDRLIGWPDAKRRHPMTGDDVGFLGCYFDDDGVNPMHDEFFDPMGPEAPALLDLARREAPDLAVSLHSHAFAPSFHRTKYAPLEIQADCRAIHRRYNSLLEERGLPWHEPIGVAAEGGSPPSAFNLVSALYHVSGTTPLLHECPHGLSPEGDCSVDHEAILDVQLALYEAVLTSAVELAG